MQAFGSLTGANTLGFGASLLMNERFENNGGDFNNGAIFDGINAASLNTAQRIDSGGHHSSSGYTGSVYVRWGKYGCPQTGAQVVYNGYAAASYPLKGLGGSTQLECLPYEPTWLSNKASTPLNRTLLTAAKYTLDGHSGVVDSRLHNSLILCSVCYTDKSPVLMIPGRVGCPNGWLREYYGYLMSTPAVLEEHYRSSSNYCIDVRPDLEKGHDDTHGQKLTFVQAGHCFSDKYPCTKYVMGYKIACTVCTKTAATL